MTAADRCLRCLEVKVRNGSPAHVVPDPFASKENEEKQALNFLASHRAVDWRTMCAVFVQRTIVVEVSTSLSMCGHIPSFFFHRAAPQVLQCGFLVGSRVHSRCLPRVRVLGNMRETWQMVWYASCQCRGRHMAIVFRFATQLLLFVHQHVLFRSLFLFHDRVCLPFLFPFVSLLSFPTILCVLCLSCFHFSFPFWCMMSLLESNKL